MHSLSINTERISCWKLCDVCFVWRDSKSAWRPFKTTRWTTEYMYNELCFFETLFSISLNFFPTTIATMWFWHLMMRLFHHISFCNLEDFNYSNSTPCWHLAIKKICCCASNLFRDYALWNKFQLYAAFLPFKLLNICACLKTIARLSSKTFKFWDRYSVYQVTLTTRSFLFRRTLILMSKVMSQDGLMKCS